jgi:predicted dehydrogenase
MGGTVVTGIQAKAYARLRKYLGLPEKEIVIITIPGEDLYLGEVENMADAILNGAPIRMSLADSRNNVATIQALLQSAAKGQPVRL